MEICRGLQARQCPALTIFVCLRKCCEPCCILWVRKVLGVCVAEVMIPRSTFTSIPSKLCFGQLVTKGNQIGLLAKAYCREGHASIRDFGVFSKGNHLRGGLPLRRLDSLLPSPVFGGFLVGCSDEGFF